MQIEIRHHQPAIRIPGSARAHIEQTATGLSQHFPCVGELEIQLLPRLCRFRQNHGHKIVPPAGEFRPFHRRILDELNGVTIQLHTLNVQEPRQLKQHHARPAHLHFKLQASLGLNSLRRLHLGCNRKSADRDPIFLRLRVGLRNDTRVRYRRSNVRRKRSPDVVVQRFRFRPP